MAAAVYAWLARWAVVLGLLAVTHAFAFTVGVFGATLRAGEKDRATLETLYDDATKQRARADGLATDYEKLRTARAKQAATITREVVREVASNPAYADCPIPAAGVRLINEARGHAGPGGDAASVPADSPAANVARDPG